MSCGSVQTKKNTTQWVEVNHFYKDIESNLYICGQEANDVFINGLHVGETPLVYPVTYKRRISEKQRKISASVSDPATTTLLSIISVGVYALSSETPSINEVRLEPVDVFSGNEMEVMIRNKRGESVVMSVFFFGDDVTLTIDALEFTK